MKFIPLILALTLLSGCMLPLKGGKATFSSPSLNGTVQQPQNPKDESTQDLDRTVETEIPVLPGDKVAGVEVQKPTTAKIKTTEKLHNRIGAAQKDTAREAMAKLSSLKGVVWVGILLFVFGVASAVYPPLKLIVGSVTTSAVCAAAGVALIILPSLIVGNEILILCVGGGAVIIYFFAHRHGHLRGQVTELIKKI